MSLLARLGRPEEERQKTAAIFSEHRSERGQAALEAADEAYYALKMEIHRRIVEDMGMEQQLLLSMSMADEMAVQALDDYIGEYCERVLAENPSSLPRGERAQLIASIRDEIMGLGPLEPLLKDESITEVMVNGPKHIFVERMGKLQLSPMRFHDNVHLMRIVERILTPIGRRVDEGSPMVDARLADGSRVNIVIPPLSLNGPVITIRKFTKEALSIENLVSFGTLSEDMALFLRACVKARLNVLVSGGTGSGKTTTLNVLSSFIPENDRIVTIEDAAELRLQQRHVVTMESRPANIEGKGQVTIRDLVRNALRMRPDRIVVGEVRSGEALDMLQAMNTGHDGSLTTAHANTPRDVLSRLETMVLMAGMDLPVRAIREQVSSAIDLIVHQSRIRDGSRKITYITEVQGMEGDVIVTQDIFRYEQTGVDENGKSIGIFRSMGMQPTFMDRFRVNGIEVPAEVFDNEPNPLQPREGGWNV